MTLFSPAVLRTALACMLVLSGLFFFVRVSLGASLSDAARVLGGVFALVIWTKALEGVSGWHRFAGIVSRFRDGVLARRPAEVFALLWISFASVHAINGLGLHDWQGFDIGFFVQATHNAFSPRAFMFKNIDGDLSFFAHHFSPFLFLLAPLGRLSEAPFALYLVQDAAVALTGALLFREVKTNMALPGAAKGLVLFLMVGHPFWLGLVHYEFHELSFAPLAMLFLLRGWQRREPGMVVIAALALLCIKETAVFSLVWFGAVLLATERSRAFKATGTLLCFLAVGVYFAYFRLILPSVLGRSESMFTGYFGHLGASMGEVALSPLLRPGAFWASLFSWANLVYLFSMFAIMAPFLGRGLLLLVPVLPDFLMTLLAGGKNIKHTGFQYAGIVLVPVLLLAMRGLEGWDSWSPGRRRFTVGWVVCFSLAFLSTNPLRVWKAFFFSPEQGLASRPFVSAVRAVPADQALVVTDATVLPFAAQRETLVWMPPERFKPEGIAPGSFVVLRESLLPRAEGGCAAVVARWQDFLLCRWNGVNVPQQAPSK